jgi:thiamine transporter
MSYAQILVECALMVALSFVLSILPGIEMPFGGKVTWFSTLPIIIASLRHRARWGVPTALVYSLTQLLIGGVSHVPAGTFAAMLLCALLDYIAAYTALGLTGDIAEIVGRGGAGSLAFGVAVTGAARLLCSILSGGLLWGSFAYEGWNIWTYSLVYNALWCVPDVLVALVGAVLLARVS